MVLYLLCFTEESVGFWYGDWEEAREEETRKIHLGFRRGTTEANPTRNHEVVGSIPGLDQCVKDLALL